MKFQPGDTVLIGDVTSDALAIEDMHPLTNTQGEVSALNPINEVVEVLCVDGEKWWFESKTLALLQTFKKFDSDKPRFSLVPQEALDELILALEYGAKKYDENPNNPNWAKGSVDRYMDALMRHIMAHRRGEEIDPESQIKHLTLALTNLVFITALNTRKKGN